MTELSRAQLQAWEASLQMASNALEDPGAGPARLRGRLRSTTCALRESMESVRRQVEAVAGFRRELAAEQERLGSVIDYLPMAYLLTTADGTILRVNPAASVAVNVSARALVGRNLLIFLDERESWLQVLTHVMASGAATRRVGRLRPRERLQVAVVASLAAAETLDGPAVQWFLSEGFPEHVMQGGRRCTPSPGSTPSSPQSS